MKNDYLKACVIDGPKGCAEKLSKAEFKRFATENGLHFCGTVGSKTMPEIMAIVDVVLTPPKPLRGGATFPTRDERTEDPDKIVFKGYKLSRIKKDGGVSACDISGSDTSIWKYRGFYFVHTFSLADRRCSFDSMNTVSYC